jgi:hypothetical protein
MSTRLLRLAPIVVAVGLSSCSGGAHSTLPPQQLMPQSISPASIPAAPMAKTAILPSSAMRSPDQPNALALQGLHFTQIAGSASEIAAAPDGSLWALSTLPTGPDKYIWHYSNRTWTNISGLAQHIAAVAPVASSGSPAGNQIDVINSGGGVFTYNGTNWTALGGGAAAVTAGLDGSVYVTTNGGSAADKAIWMYNGSWNQQPGSGVTLAASWDLNAPYSIGAGPVGTNTQSGNLFILNSAGNIWYNNLGDGTFAQIAGSASAIAPTLNSGLFVLSYPANASGSSIYYYDLNSGGWLLQPGAGVGLTVGYSNQGGPVLYVLAANGGIFSTPATSTSVLTGGGTSANVTPTGAQPMSIAPADNTYTGTVTFGSNDATSSSYMTMAWGTFSQISGTFRPGALPSSIGTALIYLDVVSSYVYPSYDLKFSQTPAVTMTTTGSFPGTRCGYAIYTSNGSNPPQWASMTNLGINEVTPSGNSFTVPAATISGSVDFYAARDAYVAPYCH